VQVYTAAPVTVKASAKSYIVRLDSQNALADKRLLSFHILKGIRGHANRETPRLKAFAAGRRRREQADAALGSGKKYVVGRARFGFNGNDILRKGTP
jgi:hypothetical protein